MLMRIPQLPMWCMTNINPALYDSESLSVVEQTGKIYAKMQALIDDYNKFAIEVNEEIKKLISDTNISQEEFECKITKLVHDYIITIDSKIAHQDRKIEEFINEVKTDIGSVVTNVINEMKESGELTEELTKAFEDLGVRIGSLEIQNNEVNTKIENIDLELENLKTEDDSIKERITVLENEKVQLIYDSEDESLTFENILEGGITNE